jgi:outer membrane protein OmpA-like peptidoglycan-associated protein
MKKLIAAFTLASFFIIQPAWSDPADPAVPGAPQSAPANADQADNNYYWQGTQLYNLGRLGEAFENFEKAVQKKQNEKESEAYLLQIRQEIVANAKKKSEEKATLNYGGNSPQGALNVTYVQKDFTRITLQADYLFDENSTSMKAGAVDVLNRLADMLDIKEGNHIELNVVDNLDAAPEAKDLDAERALAIFSYLNFKKLGTAGTPGTTHAG